MSRSRRRLSRQPPGINLIPLLDMVSLLIQLMLVNAQFDTYAQVGSEVAAPSAGASETPDKEALSFEVALTKDGFQASWHEATGTVERKLPCRGACTDPTAWDSDGLGRLGVEIKTRFPAEQRVVVRPAPGVPFDVIVKAMDALRGPVGGKDAQFGDVVLADGPT